MWASSWALVLFFGPCLVYCYLSVTTNSGTINDGQLRVDSGVTVSLDCTVHNNINTDPESYGTALWSNAAIGLSFENRLLHPDTEKYQITQKFTSDGSQSVYTLTIKDVDLEDEMEYTCQNTLSETEEVMLLVTTAAKITNITGMQTAMVGQDVSLKCTATGSPAPEVRWRHTRPNTKLPNGIEGEYKRGIDFNILAIKLEERGEYECIASNGVPNANTIQRETTFIRMNYQPVVTALTDENPEVTVPVGDAASLTCKSMAYPRPTADGVTWYQDDTEINGIDGFTVSVIQQLASEKNDAYNETIYSTLEIIEVNSNSTGEYKCRFKNDQGASEALIMLAIGERDASATTPETVTYKTKMPEKDTQDGNDCCKASVLSLSLVTMLSMILFSMVH